MDKDRNLLKKIEKEVIWEVAGYWNELHVAPEDSQIFRIRKEDNIQLLPTKLIGGGEKAGL